MPSPNTLDLRERLRLIVPSPWKPRPEMIMPWPTPGRDRTLRGKKRRDERKRLQRAERRSA